MASVSGAATHVVTSSLCSSSAATRRISRQEVLHKAGLHRLEFVEVLPVGIEDPPHSRDANRNRRLLVQFLGNAAGIERRFVGLMFTC